MDFPQRKRNRLKGYDYSHSGIYFVTICASPRKNVFWIPSELDRLAHTAPTDPVGADIIRPLQAPLSEAGRIVETAILSIAEHYDGVEADHYCIMPDHVHLLLLFEGDIWGKTEAPPLSIVIGSLKRWVSKQLGYSIWQKSFYDHIIRSEKDFHAALHYIERNPAQWQADHGDDIWV